MSREDLRAMFTELAEGISPTCPVSSAVAQAVRVRRRRRAVVGAAVAVVVVSAASVALWGPPGGSSLPIGPTPPSGIGETTAGMARVDRVPGNLTLDPHAAPYWPRSVQPPANAPDLADAPISHAVMLYSPPSEGSEANPPPTFVYGEGSINGGSGDGTFHWARVRVDLAYTVDMDGNRAPPLDQNSLGPMGTLAAFAQPDSVVLVDLLTGSVDRIAVPGLNEEVTWLANGRHVLVSSATQTWLVDTCDTTRLRPGCVEPRAPIRARAFGPAVTPLVGGGTGLTTLTAAGSADQPPVLTLYEDGGLVETGRRTVDQRSAAPYRISYLVPRGWRYGNLIAQVASDPNGSTHSDFVAVIDDRSATVNHILDLGTGHNKGCCTVLGWQGGDDILVYTDMDGLLSWHLPTGEVTRLTDRAAGIVSVAPNGCDITVRIAGLTYSCIT